MAAGEVVGQRLECPIERSEGDTKDIVFRFTSDGSPVDTTGWTAVLSLGTDKDTLAPGITNTFPGTGGGTNGLVTVDMALFDALKNVTYKYDLRISEGGSEDWVAAGGNFKVVPRIN